MIRNYFLLLLQLCLISGCNARQGSSSEGAGAEADGLLCMEDTVRYAAGYRVTCHDGYANVEVRDPWNAGRLLQRYLLVPRDAPLPEGMPGGVVVRVPLRRMAVYTSVHCSVLDALGAAGDIVGVCESRYINVPSIKERLRAGLVADLGEATSPVIEKMIETGTEAVFASPFDNGGYGPVEKLGIPIIECADYMETDPLGRAEWIKFIGLLTGRVARADSLFRRTEADYLRIKALADGVERRPALMTGLKYGAPWYVPAGESFMARIYRDAGADYLFARLPGTGGTPLSFETVLDRAIHADLWLIQYNRAEDMTYGALKSDYSPYSRFDAFANRRIYGCNTSYSLYYEEVPMHPDYLLAELIAIFHPQLLPDYKFRYFAPLKE
ncbi:MAG: ABC transporter substrate-binding protein [Tannerella sp.]|jgi:iron complex transport system substrate-binding protein|nr:ABC transporter substrate-binding protein [Tannerella sp.]